MASSQLHPGETVIDDSTPDHAQPNPHGFGTGLDYSSRTAAGYAGVAQPFPTSLMVPESEWQGRIEELEQRESRLSDIIIQAKLPPKNQGQTGYCWINAPTHALEIIRVVQNEPMVILSPASAGAQIKNYQNVGGWDREALDWLTKRGAVPVDKWPANAIDRRYATAENAEIALKYRVDDWWQLDNSIAQMVSCLFRRIPVCVGLGWWGHEITYCDPVWVDGQIGIRFRNSWGNDWPTAGASGWSILQGRKMNPDSSVAPRTALAY